jgi:predicted PurR-regulated permease PerM
VTEPIAAPRHRLIPPRPNRSLGERVVNALIVIACLAIAGGVAWTLRFMVAPIVGGLLLVYVLDPIADRLENSGLKRSTAVLICFGLLAAVLAAFFIGTLPTLEAWLQEAPQEGETSQFTVQLEHRLHDWQAALASRYPGTNWSSPFEKIRHFLEHQQKSLVEGLPAMAMEAVSHVGTLGLALVIAFFVLLDGSAMKKAVVALVPNRHFENALLMLHRVDQQISSYLIGTAVENVLVTILIAIPLWFLGMPNAFLFAVIFGAANVIPFAGPFIGAFAGLLFSLLDPNAPSLGALLVVYVVVHLVDAMFINPLVMGKSLNMHPMTVIVGIAIGGTLGGVLGMLAIIPLIAIGKAIVETIVEGVRNAATA